MSFASDVVIIGGCGHVGLPLGIVLADSGASVLVYDINKASVDLVNDAVMPFDEPGAGDILRRVIDSGALRATAEPSDISSAENVVVVIGTPIDEHLNPDLFAVPDAVEQLADHLVDGQLLVLRSTIYPGVTEVVE